MIILRIVKTTLRSSRSCKNSTHRIFIMVVSFHIWMPALLGTKGHMTVTGYLYGSVLHLHKIIICSLRATNHIWSIQFLREGIFVAFLLCSHYYLLSFLFQYLSFHQLNTPKIVFFPKNVCNIVITDMDKLNCSWLIKT